MISSSKKKGDFGAKIYQLVSGSAKEEHHSRTISYQKGDLFGILAFLSRQEASDPVCACEKTQVIVIEGYYLNVLFQHVPSLAGRFFQHLARLLCATLIKEGYF